MGRRSLSAAMEANETAEGGQPELKRTPLYERHVALGARIVPFAGWEMPVQYRGILAEHRAVRAAAGLFDLGHMGQVAVEGPGALDYLQYVTSNDVGQLAPGEAQYGLLPNETGGVVDDIITYRRPDASGYMVVINAANATKDVAWMQWVREKRDDLDVQVQDISDTLGMIAIQGPRAEKITQGLTETDLSTLPPFSWHEATVGGIPLMIARTGYTGEDGFEFYPAIDQAAAIWDALLEAGEPAGLAPVGLGARDTLRLEARMPLYGSELADDISPLEAGLGWAVKLDKGEFIGRDAMQRMKDRRPPRRTVGFKMTGRSGTPRSHYPVQVDGEDVGHVTSGAFSPTLDANIGLALVRRDVAGAGKPLDVVIRDKPVPATQVKLPFYRRSTDEPSATEGTR